MNEQRSLIYRLAETYEHYRAERRASAPEQDAHLRQSGRLRGLLRWFIPNGGTLLLVTVLALTANAWARPLLGPASAPGPSATNVNYQGRLANTGGSPLTGTYGMAFSLWDAATGGNLVWGPESHTAVPASQGLFSVGLGSQTTGGIPTSVWNGDRYLQITVGGENLSPRELLRSVPIAGMALTVPDGSITTSKLAITYDGYWTWFEPSDIPPITAPGWVTIANSKYRPLSITVSRNAMLDISVMATLRATANRAAFLVCVDGVERTTAYTSSNVDNPVSARVLIPVEAGTHTIALKIGSWDPATVYMQGPLSFSVIAYGR